MSLILASGSPRRRELMALITPNYTVAPSDVDESRITAATPAQLAQALAEAKALAVAQQHPDDTVIGCDTVVDCDGAVFGKPSGEEDAVRMLHALSGREHKVHTGLCVVHGGKAYLATETTRVQFAPIEESDLLPMRAPRNRMTKPGLTPSRAMLRCGAAALWDVITILWVCPYTVWHRYCARPERCNGSAAAAWLLRRVVRILCAAHPHKHMMGR